MLTTAIARSLRRSLVETNPRREEHGVNKYVLGLAGITAAFAIFGAYRHIKRKRQQDALAQQVPVPQP